MFLSDVKGDLSGLAKAGSPEHKLHAPFETRAGIIGFEDFDYDVVSGHLLGFVRGSGAPGSHHRCRKWGRLLLSRLLDLTEAQEGILNIAFRLADEEGLPIARPQRPAGLVGLDRSKRQIPIAALLAMCLRLPSGPSSALCSCSTIKGAPICLASPPWNWPI